MKRKARECGLTINVNKTKYMVMKDRRLSADLIINWAENRKYAIEKVEQRKYLEQELEK